MDQITAEMKVAEVVRRWPSTIAVFRAYSCPDMRRGLFSMMARIMSLRAAARIHRIPLDRLLEDLNRAANRERGAVA